MEVLVCGCVGALAALAAATALGVLGEDSFARDRAVARPGGRRSGRQALRAVGHAVRCALPTGAVPAAMAREVRTVAWRSAYPFAEWEDDAAFGVVLVASAAGGVLACVVASSFAVVPLGAAAPAVALWARGVSRGKRERRRVERAMPEVFEALALSLGSGLTLAQAMRYVGAHAQEPVRTEFARVACAVSCGVPAAEALTALTERLPAPGLELVTLALGVSQRTGAPLKDLLSEAARLVGDRVEMERRLDVKTSQARMSARLVAAMPVAMLGFLSLFSADFRAGLATVPGALSVAVALALNGLAWVCIRRIMRVRW